MTWREITTELRKRYQFLAEEPSFFVVEFVAGVLVRVRVDLVGAFGAPWLLLRAEVCGEVWLDPRAALRRNDDQAHGTLSLWDGVYYLRHTVALADVDAAALPWMLEMLAVQAGALRRDCSPSPRLRARFGLALMAADDSAVVFDDINART
jgi:hypothetical protein